MGIRKFKSAALPFSKVACKLYSVGELNKRLNSECSSKDYIYIYKKGRLLVPLNLTLNIAVIDIRLIKASCNYYGPQ